MQMLRCQNCGATVHWDGASRVAACRHCGTEYLMHPQSRDEIAYDGIGRDEVAVIPIREGDYAGRVFARSFIPKGWTASAANPAQMASFESPLVMRVRYRADDGSATVSRTGALTCMHIDDTPQNAPQQWKLQMSDGRLLASYRDAAGVCDMALATSSATSCELVSHDEDMDDLVRGLVAEMEANVREANAREASVENWGYDYCRRTYRTVGADGRERLHRIEALVDYVSIPPSPAEVQLYQQAQALLARTSPLANLGGFGGAGMGALGALGAAFGMGRGAFGLGSAAAGLGNGAFGLGNGTAGLGNGAFGLGGGAAGLGFGSAGPQAPGAAGLQAPAPRNMWETVFMLDVEAAPEAFEDARQLAALIRSSYQETPEFKQEQGRLRDMVLRAQLQRKEQESAAYAQMVRDSEAHWDRMSDITRDLNDHANSVMREMIASNAASHDRTANLTSEMIRDVNTYHTMDGNVVEASTSWDHVYQSTDRPDRFVATEGFELRPGIDFEELPRTQGDY